MVVRDQSSIKTTLPIAHRRSVTITVGMRDTFFLVLRLIRNVKLVLHILKTQMPLSLIFTTNDIEPVTGVIRTGLHFSSKDNRHDLIDNNNYDIMYYNNNLMRRQLIYDLVIAIRYFFYIQRDLCLCYCCYVSDPNCSYLIYSWIRK